MNRKKTSMGRKVFLAVDVIVILLLCLICMVPLLNLLAYSFSASQPIIENKVFLWPKEFTLKAYQYVLESKEFWSSVSVSVKRVLLGVPLNTLLTILVAYPLSKDERQFKARKYYVAYMLTVMLFNGGLMPTYLLMDQLGLVNTVWAILLPGALNVWNMILARSYYKTVPIELYEAASMDGSTEVQYFFKILIPVCKPIIAVLCLYQFVAMWNSYFDAMIYLDDQNLQPLQLVLRSILVQNQINPNLVANMEKLAETAKLADLLKYSTIVISSVPLIVLYPFFAKSFEKGVMIGSVKG